MPQTAICQLMILLLPTFDFHPLTPEPLLLGLLPGRGTESLIHYWEEARREAEQSPRGFVLAIDEIQKIPGWSDTVKGLWDADRSRNLPLHVIILGSAPLLVQSRTSRQLSRQIRTDSRGGIGRFLRWHPHFTRCTSVAYGRR